MDLNLFDTPVGRMGVSAIEEKGIVRVYLPGRPTPRIACRKTPLLVEAERQLLAYLNGALQVFDLPLAPEGTEFRCKVWDELLRIPYGQTISYGELASRIGNPKAVRAVGQANHFNPIPILIPCHRVVGKNGTLTGYAGGLELKQKLLELEGIL